MDVRTLCLGILALGDATGYEIKKLVADGAFSFFSEASYGSIYPALARLMEEGLVTCREESQDGKPDKKVYSLTPKGRAELTHALERDPGPDRQRSEFLAALLFAEAVSPERVAELIDDRIDHHRDRIQALEEMARSELTPAGEFVLGYGLSVQRAALDYLEKNRARLMSGKSRRHAHKAAE
ncbi:MAG: PadR family transcriptional regulator [Pseudomonadota bacterium]|jgi:PadR family transcriptional regulator AphA